MTPHDHLNAIATLGRYIADRAEAIPMGDNVPAEVQEVLIFIADELGEIAKALDDLTEDDTREPVK